MKRGLLRAAAALLVALLAGALGPACPSRDLQVDVTVDGAVTVFLACEAFRDACTPGPACNHNRFLCDAACRLRDACNPGPGETATWDPTVPMAARMLLMTTDPLTVQAQGSCEPLDLRGCLLPESGGCAPLGTDATACFTDAIRAAVDASLGSDLTFGGFHDPSTTLLVLSLFEVPGSPGVCGTPFSVTDSVCSGSNLVAAAGFAPPLAGGTYDITCASCFQSERSSIGHDTGPCPTTLDACFARRVADVLAASP